MMRPRSILHSLIFLVIWAGVTILIAINMGGFTSGTAARWSPVFLAVTGILTVFQIANQYVARQQFEYLFSFVNVVLLIQAFTLLVTLLARMAISQTLPSGIPWWAPVVLSVGSLLLLSLVIVQTMTLSWLQRFVEGRIDDHLGKWYSNDPLDGSLNSPNVLKAIKKLTPLDIGNIKIFQEIPEHPRTWDLIHGLLPKEVHPKCKQELMTIIKSQAESAPWAANVYWYSGMSGTTLGAWVVVFGASIVTI